MSNNGAKKSKKKCTTTGIHTALARRWIGTAGSWFRVDGAIFFEISSHLMFALRFVHMCGATEWGSLIKRSEFLAVAYLAIVSLSLCLRINLISFVRFGTFCLLSLIPFIHYCLFVLFDLFLRARTPSVFFSTFSSSSFPQFKQFKK